MTKTLLIVDMQKDFMPGGALGVPDADRIAPLLNRVMPRFPLVLATQDWHPADHASFDTSHPGKHAGDMVTVQGIPQILWPVHCVQDTKGSEFVAGLNQQPIKTVFYKGTDKWIDSYSAFFDNAREKSTGLDDYLKAKNIKELYIAGVATDYCVLYSVIDALDLGYTIFVLVDCCRGINLDPQDVEDSLATMLEKGANIIQSTVL